MGVRIIITVFLLISATLTVPCSWALETMQVQIKSGPVRTAPSFLGRISGTLQYGDRVQVVRRQNGWAEVLHPRRGIRGWLHQSALTSQRIELSAGDADVRESASSDELALAGKGFTKQVEGEYRSRHADLNYAMVDEMEQIRVSSSDIREFLETGQLKPGGGAP